MKCRKGRHFTGLQIRVQFSYFSTQTYVVSTQKNRLNETVLLSTQNTYRLMGKEINAILGAQTILIWTYDFILVYSLPMYLLPVSRKKRVECNETKKKVFFLQLWPFWELYNGEVLMHQDCLYQGTELRSAVLPAYSESRNDYT